MHCTDKLQCHFYASQLKILPVEMLKEFSAK